MWGCNLGCLSKKVVLFICVFHTLLVGCATSARPSYSTYALTTVAANPSKQPKPYKAPKKGYRPSTLQVKSNYYTVKRGDTAYSIAFEHNIDFKLFVRINRISSPYTIVVGDKLVVNPKISGYEFCEVKPGDTVYSLSKKYGYSVKAFRNLNGIGASNIITVGDVLIVGNKNAQYKKVQNEQPKQNYVAVSKSSAPAVVTSKVTKPSIMTTAKKTSKSYAKRTTTPKNKTSSSKSNKSMIARNSSRIKWQWPNNGTIIEPFSVGERGNKGIDIGGRRGNEIKSAADGKIVYAGNALRGYGNLIIINHNDDYLSAYAHNDDILVKEGQQVKAGETIARMGDTDASSVRLHFEIRYRGESVNPVKYLPRR